MRLTKPIFNFIIFILILNSCGKNRTGMDRPEVIKINIDDKSRDKLDVTFDLIPLDTMNGGLLGYIGMVKYFDDRFYILNNNRFNRPTLFAFDRNGKLAGKTVLGRGPGEVVEPFAFAINKTDSVIVLHDQATGSTQIYDLSLNFIKKLNHNYVFRWDLYHINADTFLVYHDIPKRDSKGASLEEHYSCTIYTDDFNKEKHIEILTQKDKNIGLRTPVSINNNEILFILPINNNIYQLVGDTAKVRYILDFGKQNISFNELKNKTLDEIVGLMSAGEKVFNFGICKTRDFLVINTAYKDSTLTFFYSTRNKKVYCLNDLIISGQIPDCLIWGVTDQGEFFGLIEPTQLIKFQQSGGLMKKIAVNENDNPYIALLRVRVP